MVAQTVAQTKVFHTPAALREPSIAEAHPSVEELATHYRRIVRLSPSERLATARRIVAAEYEMDDQALLERTRKRLLAWLRLSPVEAEIAASNYDQAMQELKATSAMRRVMMVQSIFSTLNEGDADKLRAILPESMIVPPIRFAHAETQPPRRKENWLRRLAFWKAN